MLDELRILMPTDVPFWNAQTGAQQRILQLVKALTKQSNPSITVKTFFVHPADDLERQKANARELDVEFHSSDQPPTGLARTLKWRFDGTINLAKQKLKLGKPTELKESDETNPVKLADFRWPWAIDAFKESVTAFEPHLILSQYITMSYLLEGLSRQQRGSIHCMVDTHDVLSLRQQQFKEFGYPHWIDISYDEEASSLQQFDSVIAIHESERNLFGRMAPDSKVIVAGHSAESLLNQSVEKPESQNADTSRPLRVGYLGSSNHSNLHALNEFIEAAWAKLASDINVELVIAGGICASLDSSELDSRTKRLGPIETLNDFYDHVDIVVNPVSFGTGLKIKSCEAFAFGKPSLVSIGGLRSLPKETGPATIVVDKVADMAGWLERLTNDRLELATLQIKAVELAKEFLCDEVVYRELILHLKSL